MIIVKKKKIYKFRLLSDQQVTNFDITFNKIVSLYKKISRYIYYSKQYTEILAKLTISHNSNFTEM